MQEERLGKKSLRAVQPPWGALCWPGRGAGAVALLHFLRTPQPAGAQ